MVWNEIKKGLRACATPFAYLLSGFDHDVATNFMSGSDSLDGKSSMWSMNQMAKAMGKDFFKEASDSIEKTGDQDGIEKIAELKQNREENIEDWLKRLKTASLAEKKQIMDEIVSQTRAEQDAVNKILGESNRKLEKQNLKSLEEARQAQQDGDNKKAAELFALVNEQKKEIHQQNKIRDHLDKQKKENEKLAKELEQQIKANQTWYSDINWGSWQVWLVVISFLAFGYLIYRTIMWAYENYLASWFTKE